MTEQTDLRDAVNRLTRSIELLEATLVRKDVYESNERARDAEVATLRDRVRDQKVDADDDLRTLAGHIKDVEDKRAADRRVLLTSLVFPIILLLVNVYIISQLGGAA